MSVVIAEGVVEVTADARKVPGQISRDIESNSAPVGAAGGALGGHISSGVGRGMLGLGKVVAVGMLAATTAVGIGLGAIITKGVAFQSAMQNYTASFTPLLGSADAAKTKLAELSAMGASTPFQLTDLADASQTLLSFGETSANLMPDLRMLGDISQGNTEKFKGLSLVFGQVQSTGRLMGGDVLQMINQGFNPLVEISKKTGESMIEVKTRMEAGKISFDEVKGAMQSATAEGGMFYDAMNLGAQTLTGVWSSTQDASNILSGSLITTLTPALTDLLGQGVNPLLGGLVGLVNGTDGAGAAVDTAAGSIVKSLQNIQTPLVDLASNLGMIFTALAPALGAALGAVVGVLVTLLPSIIDLAGGLVIGIVTSIAENAPKLVDAAVPVILNLVEGLVAMLPMLTQTGLDVLVSLMDGITTSLPTLIPAVVAAVIGTITTLFAPANLTALLASGQELLMALVGGLLAALPGLIAALPAIIIGIVTFLIDSIPVLIDTGISLFMALVKALPLIITGLVAAIPKIVTSIVLALMGAMPQLIQAGIRLFIALIENLPTIIGAIVMAVPQIINGLVKAFTSPAMVGQLASAGGNLIKGLWQGISDVGGWLWGKVSGFFGGFVDKIKGFFGIKSPSALFRDKIGAMLGLGMADGILGTQGAVSDAAAKLSAAAMGELGGGDGISVTMGAGPRGGGIGGDSRPPMAPGSASLAGGGAGITIQGNVILDASNVKSFTDVVDMIKSLPQVARAGRGPVRMAT